MSRLDGRDGSRSGPLVSHFVESAHLSMIRIRTGAELVPSAAKGKCTHPIVLPDFPHKSGKRLVHIELLLGGGLDAGTVHPPREFPSLCKRYLHQKGRINRRNVNERSEPFIPTCRSNSRSLLFATRTTGKESLSFVRRICW
jgi:hypothetical protein